MRKKTISCVLSIIQSSGVEINIDLVLDEKPTRTNQKIKTLSQYVQQYPSGWKKRLELANLLYITGCWQQAIQEYQQVIERQPQLIEVQLKLGKMLQLMGQKTDAVAVYENALSLTHHEATRQHINGLIAVCRDDIHKAILAFESATSLEPDNVAHWLALGRMQMYREDVVTALRAFETILSIHPDDIVALIERYDALLVLGKIRAAQECLDRLVELASEDFRVLKRQIENRCWMRLVLGEQGKQTKQIINLARRLAPDAVDTCELLAYYHIFQGDWATGVGVLAQFTEKHPNHPRSWYSYGRCLFHTGDYHQAASAMLKAYHLYPKDCEIYRALCEILPLILPLISPSSHLLTPEGSNGIPISLALIVEEMLERFPQRWSVWTTAGRVLVEHFQEIDRGCDVSARATQLQPQLPHAWFRHGRVLALAGKHQEAVEALTQGWQLLADAEDYLPSVSVAVWLGESYRVLGDEAASREWWFGACQQALALMEFEPPTVCYWLGKALQGLGDVRGAVEAYQRSLNQQLLYPFRGEVEEALKQLQVR